MGTTAEAEQLSGAQVIPATAAHAAGHSDRQLRDIAAFLAAHMSILPNPAQLHAAIADCHSTAADQAHTDWRQIARSCH